MSSNDKTVYHLIKHFKSLEPPGWNDEGLINIYNEVIMIKSGEIKSELGSPETSTSTPWIVLDGTPAKSKKQKKKVKKHKFKPGERCMVDFEGMFCKAEIKMVDNGKKVVHVQLTNMEDKVLVEYPMDQIFQRKFWDNDHFGTTNKDIKWGPGDPCYALFYDDGELYDAVVQEICEDDLVVSFEGYNSEGNHLVKSKHVYPPHIWPDDRELEKLKKEAAKVIKDRTIVIDDPAEDENVLERNLDLTLRRRKRESKLMREKREKEAEEERRQKDKEERRKEGERRHKELEERRREQRREREKPRDEDEHSSRHRRRRSETRSPSRSSRDRHPIPALPCNGASTADDPTLCLPALKDMPAGPLKDFDKDALTNMLVGWYMAGYHTGLYRGLCSTPDEPSVNGDS